MVGTEPADHNYTQTSFHSSAKTERIIQRKHHPNRIRKRIRILSARRFNMKKSGKIRYGILGATFLFCTVMVMILLFGIPSLHRSPSDTELIGTDGNNVASVSILDLTDLSVLTSVNYTPDKFLQPNQQIQGTPIDLTQKHQFALKGTFVFIIRNLDPFSPDFTAEAQSLNPYLQGDGSWHFTLYIPRIWSACNVYVKSVLTQRIGEISDYKFIEYTEYSFETESHVSRTEPLFLDLSFYPRQQAISPEPLQAATVVTLHYESTSVKEAGLEGYPLIGSDSAVRSSVQSDQTLSTILYVLAALITAMFIFVCFLKKTLSFLPHLCIVLGIFGFLLSSYILTTSTFFPYVWNTLKDVMLAFILLSAFHIVCDKKYFSAWLIITVLISLFGISIPILEILPFDFSAWEPMYKIIATIFFSCAILVFVALSAKQDNSNIVYLVNPLLVGILGIFACLPNINLFAVFNPTFWMCGIILFYTTYLGGCVFIRQEKKLNYLTKNLQSEVQIQTREMKTMIEERDQLLRYVSHDMKKPVTSMENLLCILRQRESDPELRKTLDILCHKANELTRNFKDLASYSKNNFAAENSRIFDLNELFERASEDFGPDCTANGILLKVFPCSISVYAKYNNLYSVISNVIMNAIEHSECQHIWIAAVKKKDICNLSITDDGKGISENRDIFHPYYSGESSENNTGIGLYISKNFMQSMNGDLTYRQENGKLTFFSTLPLA